MNEPCSDPTHSQSGSRTFWTTVNAAEALPGVSTPLNWTVFGPSVERAFRGTFADMGVIPGHALDVAESIDERVWAIFYGRAAGNLDTFRRFADLTPGTSGDAVEQQIFGALRPGVHSRPSRRRYPVALVKLPLTALRLPKVLAEHRAGIEAFWRDTVRPGAMADVTAARRRFAGAVDRFEAVMRPHTTAAMIAQGVYEQLRKLCVAAGRPGLETRLMTGYGASFEETRLMADLWAVSRGGMTMEAFLGRHGYHGPAEGEISSWSWREDPGPLSALVDTYRGMDETASPRAVEARQIEEQTAATAELMGSLSRVRRPAGRLLVRLPGRYIPLREVGKTAFLQALDAARAAARVVGEDLARYGVLADPEDVFYLTAGELVGDPPAEAKAVVAFRRERRQEYLSLTLPESWTGQPVPVAAEDVAVAEVGEQLSGIAVSPGVVEGRARVVTEPGEMLEEGEVLVCQTTDPSWASIMLVAGGLVIDVGGPLSHGAIVARELGVPCVINTRNGTRRLRTGDLLRVDGDAGAVVVLDRS